VNKQERDIYINRLKTLGSESVVVCDNSNHGD